MTLGQRIKARRSALGLSQAELAKRAHTEARQIRRYEADETQPSLTLAGFLASALEMSLDELVATPSDPLVGQWLLTIGELHDQTTVTVSIDQKGSGEYNLTSATASTSVSGRLHRDADHLLTGAIELDDFPGGVTTRLRVETHCIAGLALWTPHGAGVTALPITLSPIDTAPE